MEEGLSWAQVRGGSGLRETRPVRGGSGLRETRPVRGATAGEDEHSIVTMTNAKQNWGSQLKVN